MDVPYKRFWQKWMAADRDYLIEKERKVGMQEFGTIIIVDDDAQARGQLSQILLSCGIKVEKVIECENGKEALQLLENEHADLVFTDIPMEVMNGFELTARLNELAQKPSVVVTTQYNYFSYAVEMLRLGVKDYLLKPLTREKMISVLKRLMEEKNRESRRLNYSSQIRAASLQEFLLKGKDSDLAAARTGVEYELLDTRYRVVCGYNEGKRVQLPHLLYVRDDKGQNVIVLKEEEWEIHQEYFGACVYGNSAVYEKAWQLHQAYEEAWESRKSRFFRQEVRERGEFFQHKEEAEVPDIHTIEQAVHMIGTDKLGESIKLITGLVRMTRMGQCEVELFEELMNYFVLSASKSYQTVLKEADMTMEDIRRIYCFQDCIEYQTRLTEWMEALNKIIVNRFGDYKNKQKIQQALHYIHENYNKNLNMAVVTNYISMNYSLFSYTFKQYTGKNFVDYLKNLRVNEAKKLLTETDMMIMDISRAVGYDNEKHFTKVFKAECGVSPSEYRKNTLYRK